MELRFHNVDGAIQVLDKCIEANPDDAKTRCFLTLAKADAYSRGSDGEKARQVYGEAMDEFKDDERVYYRALSFEVSHRGVLRVSFAASSTAAFGAFGASYSCTLLVNKNRALAASVDPKAYVAGDRSKAS
jgi:hypothetical protein